MKVLEELKAMGSLVSAYQEIKIGYWERMGKKPALVGLESRLISVGKESSKSYRPRSLRFKAGEWKNFEKFILALIKTHFYFLRREKLIDEWLIDQYLQTFLSQVRKKALEGLNERQTY